MKVPTRRILVTGATSGLGYAIVRLLLEQGDSVVGAGRRTEALATLTKAFPDRFHVLSCDLQAAEQRESLFDKAESAFGGLDEVVCAAGLFVHQELGQISTDALEAQLDVNFRSPLLLCEQGVTRLAEGGAVLVLSSTLAARPIPTSAVYTATKAAMESVVKVAAQAGAPRGVRVNALALGVVDTPMARQQRPDGLDEDTRMQSLAALHPLGRIGQVDEVAEAAVGLLRQAWTTGSVLTMDGGLTCQP